MWSESKIGREILVMKGKELIGKAFVQNRKLAILSSPFSHGNDPNAERPGKQAELCEVIFGPQRDAILKIFAEITNQHPSRVPFNFAYKHYKRAGYEQWDEEFGPVNRAIAEAYSKYVEAG